MQATASTTPTIRHRRRYEIRTARNTAVNGFRPSHQKAGRPTTNRDAGQTSTSKPIRPIGLGVKGLNIVPTTTSAAAKASEPTDAMTAAGQRLSAANTS